MIGNRALCAGFFFLWRANIAVVRWDFCAALCGEICLAFVCAFYLFWLSDSHDLRLGMDGMLLALCDHGFERSGQCAVNNNGLLEKLNKLY